MVKNKNYLDNAPYSSQKTLESFNKKSKLIKYNVDRIEKLVKELKKQYIDNNELDEMKELLYSLFSNYCDMIYSSMEYIGYIIHIYQKETRMGSRTEASFHKIINDCHNEKRKDKYIIYKHNDFSKKLYDIGLWYYPIRLIRTKETHFNAGKIVLSNNSVFYVNNVTYGELYNEVEFDLGLIRGYFNKFTVNTRELLDMINNYDIGR